MKFYLEKWNFKNCIHFAKINKEILQIISMLFVGVNLTKVTFFLVLTFCTSLWNLLKFSQWYPLSRGVDLTTYLSFFLSLFPGLAITLRQRIYISSYDDFILCSYPHFSQFSLIFSNCWILWRVKLIYTLQLMKIKSISSIHLMHNWLIMVLRRSGSISAIYL